MLSFQNSQRYDLFIGKEAGYSERPGKEESTAHFFKCFVERSYKRPECQQEPGIDIDVRGSFVYILEDILGLGI